MQPIVSLSIFNFCCIARSSECTVINHCKRTNGSPRSHQLKGINSVFVELCDEIKAIILFQFRKEITDYSVDSAVCYKPSVEKLQTKFT